MVDKFRSALKKVYSEATGERLYLVNQAAKTVVMHMHIVGAADGIWSLRRENCNALRAGRSGNIIETKLHIAISRAIQKLKPHQLCCITVDIMNWRKHGNFHNENFDRFVREVAAQANKTQTEQRMTAMYEQDRGKSPVPNGKSGPHHQKKQSTDWSGTTPISSLATQPRSRPVREEEKQTCLWTSCMS